MINSNHLPERGNASIDLLLYALAIATSVVIGIYM
jgi:hypothetical protein